MVILYIICDELYSDSDCGLQYNYLNTYSMYLPPTDYLFKSTIFECIANTSII